LTNTIIGDILKRRVANKETTVVWRSHLRRLTPYLFLVVGVAHVVLFLWLRYSFFHEIKTSQIVHVKDFQHRGSSKLSLAMTMASIFDPKKKNPFLDYDLVPVSCYLDPVEISKEGIVWHTNLLLRSALKYASKDKATFKRFANELLLSMIKNRQVISTLRLDDNRTMGKNKFIGKSVHVHRFEIDPETEFFDKSGIVEIAALPIFQPLVSHEVLADNLALLRCPHFLVQPL
jgi:hypothetical protein